MVVEAAVTEVIAAIVAVTVIAWAIATAAIAGVTPGAIEDHVPLSITVNNHRGLSRVQCTMAGPGVNGAEMHPPVTGGSPEVVSKAVLIRGIIPMTKIPGNFRTSAFFL